MVGRDANRELTWNQSSIVFQITLGKTSSQLLSAHNTTSSTFAFKVKTTNPQRYSVRPNVGVVFPGEEAQVAVQLPALTDLPPDMHKCKDKFQLLTLPLFANEAADLQAMPPAARRAAITTLWAQERAKEATVDKLRCGFTLCDSTPAATIPEEEGPVTPYSPEAKGSPERYGSTGVVPGSSPANGGGATPSASTPAARFAATPGATEAQQRQQQEEQKQLEVKLGIAQADAEAARAEVTQLHAELEAQRKVAAAATQELADAEKREAAAKQAAKPEAARLAVPVAAPRGSFSLMHLLLVAILALLGGLVLAAALPAQFTLPSGRAFSPLLNGARPRPERNHPAGKPEL